MTELNLLTTQERRPAVTGISGGWSERFRRGVASHGSLAIFDQGVVSLANFVTNALAARACTQDDFGVYILSVSLLYFVRGFQEQLVSAPYTIYRHRRRGVVLSRYTGHTLIHQSALAIATLIFLGALALLLSQWLSPEHRLVRALLGLQLVAPCFLLREYIRKLTFANFEFRSALVLDCLVATIQMTLLFGLYWTDNLRVGTVFLAIALATGIGGVSWLVIQFQRFSFRRSQLWADWQENWQFGRWALSTHLIGCSTPYLMPWFVAGLRGEAVTGALGACQTVVGMANMFVTGVTNFLSPKTAEAFAQGGTRALVATQAKAAMLFAVTLGSFALLMQLFGDELARTIMGPTYAGLGPVMVLLALGLLANSLGMTAGNGIWAMDRPALNMSADITSLVVTFTAAALLVPEHGALGAAWSALLGHTLSASQRWLVLLRLVRATRRAERRQTDIKRSEES